MCDVFVLTNMESICVYLVHFLFLDACAVEQCFVIKVGMHIVNDILLPFVSALFKINELLFLIFFLYIFCIYSFANMMNIRIIKFKL